jgi:phosphatidate cytidylyltransferase
MLLRILSALVLVPVTLAIVFLAPPFYYLAALGIVGSLCLHEFFQIMRGMGWRGQPWFGYAGFWILLIGLWAPRIPASSLGAGLVIAAFLAAMGRRDPIRERVQGLMANLLGIFYLGLCLNSALAVRFSFGPQAGLEWTLILFAVVWTGDTAALFAGKSFGRTPFARYLSPKKTNEGALAGLAAGVLVAVLLRQFFFTDLALKHVVVAALLTGIFGQLGDLAESMLKRAAEVKESSHLIPGHGGVLDRIDSLLFAFPVLCLYLQQIQS